MLACVRGGKKHPQHKIWPYLLRNVVIDRPNQVWCADITYIPMRRRFLYLVAIHCRAVAQGSQFTSGDWTYVLSDAKIKIRIPLGDFTNHLPVIDGKGRWIDNRMIERLWRSLKYECVYLHAFETGSEAKAGIGKWLAYYNTERPHSTHRILTPNEAYVSKTDPMRLAA